MQKTSLHPEYPPTCPPVSHDHYLAVTRIASTCTSADLATPTQNGLHPGPLVRL